MVPFADLFFFFFLKKVVFIMYLFIFIFDCAESLLLHISSLVGRSGFRGLGVVVSLVAMHSLWDLGSQTRA